MSILHTVNKSPFDSDSFNTCLRYVDAGAAILLIEDGVYAAREGTAVADDLKAAMQNVKVYALQNDLDARGVNSNIIDGVQLVDYSGFVDLVAESQSVQSWL